MSDVLTKTVVLPCESTRAFELFTERAGAWWPADRRHLGEPTSEIRIERGGRFFERASDGREVELGKVRVFEPAVRLVLDWFPGTGPDVPTHVEVLFEAEGSGTRVTVSHRAGPFSREQYGKRVGAYERSWTLVLDALRVAASLDTGNA